MLLLFSDFENFLNLIQNDSYLILLGTFKREFLERNLLDEQDRKPIHLACKNGSVGVCEFLLNKGCDFEFQDKSGIRPIHVACKEGHLKIVQLLVNKNCDYEALTKENESPMHISCKYGHTNIVDFFIKKNCNLEVPGPWSYYPLHIACQNGHLEIVKLLIEKKCNTRSISEFRHQPIHTACRYGQVDVLKYLIEYGCDIESQVECSEKPIHLACKNGHIEIIKVLFEAGCSLKTLATTDQSVMHYAVLSGNLDVIKFLLINQATVDNLNSSKETPKEIARNREYYECANLLENWTENDKLIESIRNKNVKQFNKLFNLLDFDKITFVFIGCLLELSISIKTDKITGSILKKCTDNELNTTQFQSMMKGTTKTPGRVLQEFLIYQAISKGCEKIWNWVADIDVINGKCTPFESTFIELSALYGNTFFTKQIMEMLLEVNESWEKAIQLSFLNQRKEVTNLILKRIDFISTRKIAKMNRLHIAVNDDRVDVIKYIIKNNKFDPNDSTASIGTPLNMAYAYGRAECIEVLEMCTNTTNNRTQFMQTNLHIAIANCALDSVCRTLEKAQDINARDSFDCTPLHTAVIYNREDIIEELLMKDCDINIAVKDLDRFYCNHSDRTNEQDSLTLQVSKLENCFTLCLKLFGKLFNVLEPKLTSQMVTEFLDGDNNSILHISSNLLLSELCFKLISFGADINKLNSKKNSPLQEMLTYHNSNILLKYRDSFYKTVEVLVKNGTDISRKNLVGVNCIQNSLKYNDEKLLEIILNRSTDLVVEENIFNFFILNKWISVIKKIISVVPKRNITVELLIKSAKIFSFDVFQLIWENSDNEIRNGSLEELLFQNSIKENESVFKLCCDFQFDNPKLLENGETVLTALIKERKPVYYNELLKSTLSKSFIDFPNKSNWTPLHLAADFYDLNLFEIILNQCLKLNIENSNGDTALAILLRNIPKEEKKRHVILLVQIMIHKNVDIYQTSSTNIRIIDNCQNIPFKYEIEKIFKNKIANYQ